MGTVPQWDLLSSLAHSHTTRVKTFFFKHFKDAEKLKTGTCRLLCVPAGAGDAVRNGLVRFVHTIIHTVCVCVCLCLSVCLYLQQDNITQHARFLAKPNTNVMFGSTQLRCAIFNSSGLPDSRVWDKMKDKAMAGGCNGTPPPLHWQDGWRLTHCDLRRLLLAPSSSSALGFLGTHFCVSGETFLLCSLLWISPAQCLWRGPLHRPSHCNPDMKTYAAIKGPPRFPAARTHSCEAAPRRSFLCGAPSGLKSVCV